MFMKKDRNIIKTSSTLFENDANGKLHNKGK